MYKYMKMKFFYRNLIGRDYTETHYTEDGKRMTTSPKEVSRRYFSLLNANTLSAQQTVTFSTLK